MVALFRSWAEEAGYGVTVDRLGNMFVRRAGTEDGLPPVLVGSHLDNQAAGGRFDGIRGVMAGLEILRALDDAGIATLRYLEVVKRPKEEGGRFLPPMIRSAQVAGLQELDRTLYRTHTAGHSAG